MDKSLIRDFWRCGDNDIIEFAILRARLNKKEKEILLLILDDCLTQEEVAERLYLSTRRVQEIWGTAVYKLLSISWVLAYAEKLRKERK